MTPPDPNAIAAEAFRLEQLGQFAQALEGYASALRADPQHRFAANQFSRLKRDLNPTPPRRTVIVWQVDRNVVWETEWVRFLLSSCQAEEIADGRRSVFEDGAIIIDRRLGPQSRGYYFELMKRGCRFVLFHLSDEHYSDDCTAYGFANLVLRNYWSRARDGSNNVLSVPLGLMTGFRASPEKPAANRTHTWCFIGNPGKSSRVAMMQVMQQVAGGFFHGTNALNARSPTTDEQTGPHPPLGIAEYARILSDSVFAPCPAGWENLDSFRVCEALEAGCIPIVEKRESFDYFRHLFGEHPMLTIQTWHQAPALIAALRADPTALEERRNTCARWWREYKAALVVRVRESILRSFAPLVESA